MDVFVEGGKVKNKTLTWAERADAAAALRAQFSVDEIAKLADCSKGTIYQLLRVSTLPEIARDAAGRLPLLLADYIARGLTDDDDRTEATSTILAVNAHEQSAKKIIEEIKLKHQSELELLSQAAFDGFSSLERMGVTLDAGWKRLFALRRVALFLFYTCSPTLTLRARYGLTGFSDAVIATSVSQWPESRALAFIAEAVATNGGLSYQEFDSEWLKLMPVPLRELDPRVRHREHSCEHKLIRGEFLMTKKLNDSKVRRLIQDVIGPDVEAFRERLRTVNAIADDKMIREMHRQLSSPDLQIVSADSECPLC